MSFGTGALVRARGREWVVLPGSDDELVLVRPLGGSPEEDTGILTSLEEVAPARFAWPGPDELGDFRSARLLVDALRLGFRASAGPFRSFGALGVEPRAYQLVPLLMALRQERTRLLVADDVGVGKTIEAGLIARELLDAGEARGLLVLCPASLAEQWQAELSTKFHLDAECYLPGSAARLERECAPGESVFERHRCLVASIDFVKSERRREECVRAATDLVVLDEAHGCVSGLGPGRHQRYELVRRLAADQRRHLVLLSATPHSGDEGAFRNLVALLEPGLAEGLEADELTSALRDRLARHLVQRRRADLTAFIEDTPFPQREEADLSYHWSPTYRAVFEAAFAWAREEMAHAGLGQARAHWWSALALLRALSSSPAALLATLRSRQDDSAARLDGPETDGRSLLLDADEEHSDVALPLGLGELDRPDRTSALGRLADALGSLSQRDDTKLIAATKAVEGLLAEGFHPIVFCRFIDTANYVADHLRAQLGTGTAVAVVTGLLPPEERAGLVDELTSPRRVLVATDCLSEGVNLQGRFDAVVHYDLSWNPNRHEQRVGRVDRFGQPVSLVRSVTIVGADNPLDQAVLAVLLRKSRAIRHRLGIHVPVPGTTEDLVEELVREALVARAAQGRLFEEGPAAQRLELAWEDAAERERRSQSRFAQRSIHPQEVAAELDAARSAIGSDADVAAFVTGAFRAWGAAVRTLPDGGVVLYPDGLPGALRVLLGDGVPGDMALRAGFALPVAEGETYLARTHPLVAALAAHTLDAALDPLTTAPARRAAVLRTDAVTRRTTLLLLRLRFDLERSEGGTLLAEDAGVLAFEGPPEEPLWLPEETARALLDATPAGNIEVEQARHFLARLSAGEALLTPALEAEGRRRAEVLEAAHRRVRQAARPAGHDAGRLGARLGVRAHSPDVLGTYILLPAGTP